MVDRVHQRLITPGDDPEKEEALKDIWNQIGFPKAGKQSEIAFERLEKTLAPKPRLRTLTWVRIAAIWLIPLLSLGLSYYLYQDVQEVKELTFVEQFVPSGKRERIILPDGSEVWLNSGSLLLYPSRFIAETREIYLVGEAYFKIRKQPNQPFVVRTKAMRAEVLGTVFNLSAYPDQDKITITLEQGSVRILPDNLSVKPYILKPNEQLVYIPSQAAVNVRQVIAADYSDWKEGGLLFNNDSFEDILKALERFYNVKVHLRTSVYHTNRLTIHFNKNESLENILMLIKEMIPGLEYQIKEDGIYIQ